jgi:hypothetical protein
VTSSCARPPGYYVRAEEIELDCWRFDALVDRARANPAEGRAMLREALGLVRGDPLCDVACEGSVAQWRRALQARLLSGSAASGEIPQPELAEVVELALGHGVHSVAVDRDSALRWLALAERISRDLDTAPSLEEVLRDETMAALEITDLATLVAAIPAFDPTTALDEAAMWVASRSPSEIAPRDHVYRISLT